MPMAMRPTMTAHSPSSQRMCWHGAEAYPKACEALTKNHGAQAGNVLLARLREQVNTVARWMYCAMAWR